MPTATRRRPNVVRRYLSLFLRIIPPIAKVGQMTGTAIFNGNKLAGLIQNVAFGLATPLGVALAVIFGTGTIGTNYWIRARGMFRKSAPQQPAADAVAAIERNPSITASEAQVEIARVQTLALIVTPPAPQNIITNYPNANFFGPGVPIGYLKHAGYVTLQGFSVLYMFNTIPSAFLSAYSIAQLVARTPGASFDSFCKDADETSPVWKLVLVNGVALLFAYCSNVAYIVYNQPQIKIYYMKFFHEGLIKKIGWRAWAETITGVSINTMVLAFTGKASWNLLKDELFCHFGINNIPPLFVSFMVLESCITNFKINGIMTLMAVHNRHTNVHATNRSELLAKIGFSKKLHNLLLIAIIIDAIGNAAGSYVAAARFPETVDPSLAGEGIPYHWYMIMIALCVSLLGFSNTRAISEEGDIRELDLMKKEKEEAMVLEAAIASANDQDSPHESIQLDRMDESQEEKSLTDNANYIPHSAVDTRSILLPVNLNERLLSPNGRHQTSDSPSMFNSVVSFFSPRSAELTFRPTLVDEEYIAELNRENDRFGVATPSIAMCNIM